MVLIVSNDISGMLGSGVDGCIVKEGLGNWKDIDGHPTSWLYVQFWYPISI